jgi:hypothetical protein
MEFLFNPWFIAIIVVIILAVIFQLLKSYYKPKKNNSIFDRLQDADIEINIKKPINPSKS